MTEAEIAAAMERGGNGQLRPYYEVDCRLCPASYLSFATIKGHAEGDVREQGWKKTKRFGWICQDCAKRR